MISLDEALEKILAAVHVLEAEQQPILTSLGQVLAEDIASSIDVPPLDDAAMDGYAIRSESSAGTPAGRTLHVVGKVAAGYVFEGEVGVGQAVRIMTGAPVPKGADTVVQFENTDETERKSHGRSLDEVVLLVGAPRGINIRRAGENISRGDTVFRSGTLVRPQEIGVLASLGLDKVKVVRRPRVAVLSTGDELVAVPGPLAPGKLYDANSFSIASQVVRYGGMPLILGIARDNVESLTARIRQGLECDLFISSAGVSTGEYDVVKDVLAQQGEIGFWTVAMKPGKPLAFGALHAGPKRIPYLGLPGNVVSSMVAFEQFARPAILKMMGRKSLQKPEVRAISESSLSNRDGRRFFVRAIVTQRDGRYYARSTGPQGSGILTSMTKANALMIVPEGMMELHEGDEVQAQMLDWDLGE